MAVKTVDSNHARIHWRDVLDTAALGQDLVIEHYGKPTAAVIPYADFVAIQATLAALRRARLAEDAGANEDN